MLTTEERFCRRLRAALARLPSGANIPDSPEFLEALNELEYLLPDILAEVHREWEETRVWTAFCRSLHVS
ncbi:MAG TPA: hypothetical protein VHC19_15655 [Pirellulales bacterium]|nr:hypothetical protein [Pirellulales bacterium]